MRSIGVGEAVTSTQPSCGGLCCKTRTRGRLWEIPGLDNATHARTLKPPKEFILYTADLHKIRSAAIHFRGTFLIFWIIGSVSGPPHAARSKSHYRQHTVFVRQVHKAPIHEHRAFASLLADSSNWLGFVCFVLCRSPAPSLASAITGLLPYAPELWVLHAAGRILELRAPYLRPVSHMASGYVLVYRQIESIQIEPRDTASRATMPCSYFHLSIRSVR